MPIFTWPVDIGLTTKEFEQRYSNPVAGKLLRVATSCVDELHYLDEIDRAFDCTRQPPESHQRGVVDFAHARWATGTCITAVDLCAAALGRAVGGYADRNELGLGDFAKPTKRGSTCLGRMPAPALDWVKAAIGDPQYAKLINARHALTHSWLPAHFTLVTGSGPAKRLDLTVLGENVPLRQLVVDARDFAAAHVPSLITQLPRM